MGKIAQDVNALYSYFSKRSDTDTATQVLSIVNELMTMLGMWT